MMTAAVSDSALQMTAIIRSMPLKAHGQPELPVINIPPHADPRASPGRIYAERRADLTIDREPGRIWLAALIVSVVLHAAAGGAMLVDWSFQQAAAAPPPASLIVELAVMPASPAMQPSEIPPGPKQVEAAPEPTPMDRMKFDPPPQVDAALKPDFALPLKQRTKPVETVAVAMEARETTAPPSVAAPVQEKSEAPVEGNNAAPPSDAEQAWEGRILAKLERSKRYPAAAQTAGQQDAVFVRLVIDRKGRLIDATLRKSAGFPMLDGETLALAKRASPFPPPPDSVLGDRIVRVVPIEFYIKSRR